MSRSSAIVDVVAEMSRTRSVTHVLMSPDTFTQYSSEITPQNVRSGIRRGSCYGVGIVVVEGMSDFSIFSFNKERSPKAKALLELARAEHYEKALDLLDILLSEETKWLHAGDNPIAVIEEDEGE